MIDSVITIANHNESAPHKTGKIIMNRPLKTSPLAIDDNVETLDFKIAWK
jgi:hypothetical protein